MQQYKHHLLITGTGRTGTTFLVKLLTMLDFYTGFSKEQVTAGKSLTAGLEHQGIGGNLPYVIKNPKLMWLLPELLRKNKVVIDHILLPMRDINAAAESRRENVRKSSAQVAPQDVVGGLEGVSNPAEQEIFFLRQYYDFMEFVSQYHIPITLLQYPRLVLDGEYLYEKLYPILSAIPKNHFLKVFRMLSDPSLVHSYTAGDNFRVEYDDSENIKHQRFDLDPGNIAHLETLLVHQRNDFKRKNDDLLEDIAALRQDYQWLHLENTKILSSRSWRYTRPFRVLMALLRRDKRYIYDCVQRVQGQLWTLRKSLKSKCPGLSDYIVDPVFAGAKRWLKPALKKILYLFLGGPVDNTLAQFADTAGDSDYQKNQNYSAYSTDVKAVAFYVPQSCRAPVNGGWAGCFIQGIAARVSELFAANRRERTLPVDSYSRQTDTIDMLKKQAQLAKQHGIYGFCFHHYYSRGKRPLEKEIESLLDHPEIDLPFCLYGADENPAATRNGGKRAAVRRQNSLCDDLRFIEDLSRCLKDPRYIRVGGKPVILVYQPLLLQSRAALDGWRRYCRENGIGEIAIWGVGGDAQESSLENIIDGVVESPGPGDSITSSRLKSTCKTPPVSYKGMVNSILAHESDVERFSVPVCRTAKLGWDNAPRPAANGWQAGDFSCALYYRWLRYNIEWTRSKFPADRRFVFIDAWNRRSGCLEPDKKYGFAAINTTSKSLFDLPFLMKDPLRLGQDESGLELCVADLVHASPAPVDAGQVAVHAHIFYTDLVDEIIYYLNNIPVEFDCYVTTDSEAKKQEIAAKLICRLKARQIDVRLTPNVGRDVAPFLVGCRDVISRYEYVCHIHTKKSLHSEFGERWRQHLLDHLLGSARLVNGILSHFAANPQIGLIYPPLFRAVDRLAGWGANEVNVRQFLSRIGIRAVPHQPPVFPAGTMVWMRTQAFRHLVEANITYRDFEDEEGQLDGTLAHAFERSLVCIAKENGFSSLSFAG